MMFYDFMITNDFCDFLLGCLDALKDITVLNLFLGVSSLLLGPTILLSSRKLGKQILIGISTGVAANLITQGLGSLGTSKSGSSNSGSSNSGSSNSGSQNNNSGGKSTGGDSGGNSTGGDSGKTNSEGKK